MMSAADTSSVDIQAVSFCLLQMFVYFVFIVLIVPKWHPLGSHVSFDTVPHLI